MEAQAIKAAPGTTTGALNWKNHNLVFFVIFVPFCGYVRSQHCVLNPSRADCGPVPRIFCAIAPVCLQFFGLDHAAACFMGIGSFFFLIWFLCAQSAVVLPKAGFLSPIWLLCLQPAVVASRLGFGATIMTLSTRCGVWAANPEIERAISGLETRIANWGQHWSGGD